MKNKIVFICAQPDVSYFHWQVEVFINDAIRNGVNPNWIEIIFAYEDNPTKDSIDLARRYPFVRFFFYEKTKIENYGYIPILRPDVLSKHFLRFPDLSNDVIFYHDCDIIFRELPDFDSLSSDSIWYFSDTVSYIGSDYIKSKSNELFVNMCKIAGIDPEIVEFNNKNSGGAQYLMKGIDSNFWLDVMRVSLDLYKYMYDAEIKERASLEQSEIATYNPIQKWCADMWGVLWCGLKRGANIRISEELGFSWATSIGNDEWTKNKIMHNAGITSSCNGKLFYKGDYINKFPWDEDFSTIDRNSNSYNYVRAIEYANKMRKIYSLPK
jgi:hypothetical protein